ncbi:hypothetical protein N9U65_00635 [Planctomycetaceae bacterium]|nr:hypothetical protein [Planctomycetaceae bacterium]
MKIKLQIVLAAFSFGFLIFLIQAFATPTNHGMSQRNTVVSLRHQPLSLKMLAHVVRYCEENDKPMHPGIVRWASSSLTIGDNQFVQTDSITASRTFSSK